MADSANEHLRFSNWKEVQEKCEETLNEARRINTFFTEDRNHELSITRKTEEVLTKARKLQKMQTVWPDRFQPNELFHVKTEVKQSKNIETSENVEPKVTYIYMPCPSVKDYSSISQSNMKKPVRKQTSVKKVARSTSMPHNFYYDPTKEELKKIDKALSETNKRIREFRNRINEQVQKTRDAEYAEFSKRSSKRISAASNASKKKKNPTKNNSHLVNGINKVLGNYNFTGKGRMVGGSNRKAKSNQKLPSKHITNEAGKELKSCQKSNGVPKTKPARKVHFAENTKN